jgi:hypothetical protein
MLVRPALVRSDREVDAPCLDFDPLRPTADGFLIMATVVLLGTLDTKGVDYAFLKERIEAAGCTVISVNAGADLFTV